jgi:hypothetical protein
MSTGETSMDSRSGFMPVERFEPSTLAGLVFETSAYTVPPHRLSKLFMMRCLEGIIAVFIIAHSRTEVKRLDLDLRDFFSPFPAKVTHAAEFLITFFQQLIDG